jgi:hypothetical protein
LKKEQEKILLLFFHSPQQPDSKLLRRQIFNDLAFKSFITDTPELLFFPVSVESFAGWQRIDFALTIFVVAYSFYCSETPSFVLIKHGPRGVLIAGRCSGKVDVQSLLFLLRDNTAPRLFREHLSEEADDELGGVSSAQESLEASSANLATSTSGSASNSTSQLLKRQHADYEASLAKDRARELDRLEKEAELERQEHLLMEAREERMNQIASAKQILMEEPESGIKLAIQLPDGTKIQRRFSPDCEVSQVYAFVDIAYLQSDDALDYRLQSLHPPFHLSRTALLSEYNLEGQHKLYVDLTPVGLTEESEGNESDAEN